MQDILPDDEQARMAADAIINRIRQLKTWEVTRKLDHPLEFRGGPVPFDIKANQKRAWFRVLAQTKQEAEQMVDAWMQGQDNDD